MKIQTFFTISNIFYDKWRNNYYNKNKYVHSVSVSSVMEFHQKERFLVKDQHTYRRLLYFVNTTNDSLSKSAKIWLSEWIFYVKNDLNLIFVNENNSLGAHFCQNYSMITSIFEIFTIFDEPSFIGFSKYNVKI